MELGWLMDMLDHLDADRLYVLENSCLVNVVGGKGITASLIQAVTKASNTLLELGRSFGSSIRRLTYKKLCPVY